MERYAIKEKDSFVFCAANMEMWVKRSTSRVLCCDTIYQQMAIS